MPRRKWYKPRKPKHLLGKSIRRIDKKNKAKKPGKRKTKWGTVYYEYRRNRADMDRRRRL